MGVWSSVLAGLAGLIGGGIVAWALSRGRAVRAAVLLGERERERAMLLTEADRLRGELAVARNELAHAGHAAATYLAERDAERRLTKALGEHTAESEARAQRLVHALRTPHVRGQWGEMQLRRVVELAGMLEHCDFEVQPTGRDDGGAFRPDLLVRLPGEKVVIVDAKTPLDAYVSAIEAAGDDRRAALLEKHAKQVRAQVEMLSEKRYGERVDGALPFVVMFLPGESILSAACQCDPGLIEFAVSRGVVPATPTTLVTLLKSAQYGWQQERIAQNAEALRDLGGDLYRRLATLSEHFVRLNRGLTGAVEAYNDAVGSLESRVLTSARRFRAMGVADGQGEIASLERVEGVPRSPAAAELAAGPWPAAPAPPRHPEYPAQ